MGKNNDVKAASTDAKKHVVITASGSAGGQGKTLVCITLAEIRRKLTGQHPRLVDCDAEHSLASMLGGAVIQMPISVEAEQLAADPALIRELWDALGSAILEDGDCYIDVGANVDALIFEWAKNCSFYQDLLDAKIDIVVPVKAENKAINQSKILVNVVAEVFPNARVTVVLNRYKPWKDYAKEEEEIRTWPGVTVVEMPLCTSTIWQKLEKAKMTPLSVTELGHEKVGPVLGMASFVARREVGIIAEWVKTMSQNFAYIWK